MKRLIILVMMLSILLGLSAERKALIIANSVYANSSVVNAATDADSMNVALTKLGFNVWKRSNLSLGAITAVVDSFSARVTASDDVVVYYSGHGTNSNGINYIVPARLDIAQIQNYPTSAYSVSTLAQKIKTAKTSIIVLEASRMWGMNSSKAIAKPFVAMQAASPKQMIISAAQPGKAIALTQVSQSTFSQAFIERISTSELGINSTMQLVMADVESRTGKLQKPWISGAIEGDFHFGTPDMMLQWKRQPLKSIQGGGSLSW